MTWGANGTARGGGTYTCGTEVTISASSTRDNRVFTGWSGDLTSTSSSTTVLLNGDKSVHANFDHLCNRDSTFPRLQPVQAPARGDHGS